MLVVQYADRDTGEMSGEGSYWVYHTLPRERAREVVLIQADGDELVEVVNQIEGIPKGSNRVMVWRGDFAKFIFDNLRLENPQHGKFDPKRFSNGMG